MSDFAIFRFLTNGLLNEDKETIITLIEEIVHARGMERNATIGKISEKQQETLEVRWIRRQREKNGGQGQAWRELAHEYFR
jgi:hypothetical protein